MNIEYYLNRGKELIANWNSYLDGDESVRGIYNLEYLAVSIVQTFMRIERYCETFDKGTNEWKNIIPQFIQTHHDLLVVNALKGADPRATHSLMKNTINEIDYLFFERKDKDLDTDLFEQLTDCLVQRDDLCLVEQFLSHERRLLSEDCIKSFQEYWNSFSKDMKYLDEDIDKNLDIFLLISSFCEEYISFNGLKGESTYWWLFQPIQRAMELKVTSLLSVIDLLKQKKASQQAEEISTALNALVDIERLPEEEKLPTNILLFPSIKSEHIEIQNSPREYALAAKSAIETALRPAIYVLVINKLTGKAEHHPLVSSIRTSQNELNNLDKDTRKIIELIPVIAQERSGISKKPFSIDLHTTPEGCTGKSIGLPGYLEYLNKTGRLNISKPIAGTGDLQYDGKIVRVDDISLKVKQAIAAGFENILIPHENLSELDPELISNTRIKSVNDINEAVKIIHLIEHENHPAVERLMSIIPLIKEYRLEISGIEREEWNYFVKVAGYNDERRIIVYFNAKNHIKPPRISGTASGKLYETLLNILNKSANDDVRVVTENLFAGGKILNKEKRNKIQEFLKNSFGRYLQEINESGCDYRYDIIKNDKVYVKQYSSGTINVIGQSGSTWNEVVEAIELIWEQKLEISSATKNDLTENNEKILPAFVTKWIGVDEAGKGDYYGPLVTAAVFIDPFIKDKLVSIGVKDSKDLSDNKNIELGSLIQEICDDKCYVLTTMPEKYNELISSPSFKGNSQRLLGWQHRRAMENILLKHECEYAVCDQFGSEYFINEGLKTGKGSQINIIQRPKAESDLAVAAASILARREFLIRLQKMNNEYNVTFPKGASDIKAIINIAETLIKQFGKDILNKVAKVHFKTTKHILDKLSNE